MAQQIRVLQTVEKTRRDVPAEVPTERRDAVTFVDRDSARAAAREEAKRWRGLLDRLAE